MCDMRTFRRIENVVETKMAAGQMFTAFDITRALQKSRMKRPHRDIRRDIRRVADNLMWRFGYERTLVRFQEVKASAFVYHPYGTDASLHRPSLRPRSVTPLNNQRRAFSTEPDARLEGRQDAAAISARIARLLERTQRRPAGVIVRAVSWSFIMVKDSDLDLD